jgi:transcriptional regulator with XRE-family HTH domain
MTALKQVVDQLKKDGKARTQEEIAEKVQQDPGYFSLVVHAKKPISYHLLVHLYNRFNININFLISGGYGNIYRSELEGLLLEEGEDPSLYVTKVKGLQEEVITLKERIQDKDTIIEFLKKEKENKG